MATDYSASLHKFGLTDTEATYIEWVHGLDIPEDDMMRLFQESRFSSYARLMNCFIREYGEDVAMTYGGDSVALGNPPSLRVPILRTLPLRTHIFADYPCSCERGERLTAPRNIVRALAVLDTDAKSNWTQLEEEYVLSCSQLFLAYVLRFKQTKIAGPRYLSSTSYQDADRALVFFEQWCAEGHLLHPTPKAKVGITPENLIRYMPEVGGPVLLTWIALRKTDAVCSSLDAYDTLMSHSPLYPKLREILNQKVEGGADDYYLMPVHPWQLENVILPSGVQDSCVELGVGTNADALIAFRTLYCEDLLAYVKLPVTVKITSGVRALSPRACRTGPQLSQVLSRYGLESTLAPHFRFQREVLSLYLDSETNGGNVSVVYRERLKGLIPERYLPLPLAALFEPSPNIPGRRVLDDIAELNPGGYLGLYAEYLEATMLPYIELLVRYGIGIEGHLQNTIVCLKDGHLSLVVLRDPDAVSICTPRFESALGPTSWLEGWTVTDTMDDAYEKLAHSYLHSSVAELIAAISVATGMPVEGLWLTARKSMEQAFDTLLKTGVSDVQIKEARTRLLNPSAKLKSLLRMKLQDKTKEYIFASCPNPLTQHAHETV
jgi:siderophore synthetase component